MIHITLVNTELERLKGGEAVIAPYWPGRGDPPCASCSVRSAAWETVKNDPSADVVLSPHDLYDFEIDGGLTAEYRPEPRRSTAAFRSPSGRTSTSEAQGHSASSNWTSTGTPVDCIEDGG